MTRHAIGSFEFEVLRHETVVNGEIIKERFLVALFRNGLPLAWHPHDAHDGPAANQEWFEWVGRVLVDVRDEDGNVVGAKRGADFRTRFWPTLVHFAEKARVSNEAKKPYRDITDAELQVPLLKREPVSLKSRSLDDAAAELAK